MAIFGKLNKLKNNKKLKNMISSTDLVNFQWKSNFNFNIGNLIQHQALSNKKYQLSSSLTNFFPIYS